MTQQEIYMKAAWKLAKKSAEEGEVPVGCVIVCDGEIVGRGRNRRETKKSALSHAELEAIGKACKKLGGWRLHRCDLYVTLEPCPMCAGAIINARIKTVYFGTADDKAGSCGSLINLFQVGYNHKPALVRGVLQEECAELLSDFFQNLRKMRKQQKSLLRETTVHRHFMKLNPIPFEQIATGKKCIELRLNDPKRQQIHVRDEIEFTNVDNGKKLLARVTRLYRFASFAELFAAVPPEKCGFAPDIQPDAHTMDAYYPLEKQEKFGALGIELELLPQ